MTYKIKYFQHKAQAKQRGIAFNLTFEEWLAIWGDEISKRGTHKDNLCMCRTLDQGAYEVGNVRIDIVQNNGHERKLSNLYKGKGNWGKKSTGDKQQCQARNDDGFGNHGFFADPLEILEKAENIIDLDDFFGKNAN